MIFVAEALDSASVLTISTHNARFYMALELRRF